MTGMVSEGEPRIGISPANFYEMASNPRQRAVLQIVGEDGELSLDELARQVSAEVDGVPPEEVSPDRVEDMRVELYNRDLRMMADRGGVIFEQEKRVRPSEDSVQIAELLQLLENAFE